MPDWECGNCTFSNPPENFLCETCKCARSTATRKIRPPAHVRGKFMDKVVLDLVQKATKRKPPNLRSNSSTERVKKAIKKKVDAQTVISTSQKRRESMMEKQFKAKADQIAQLTQELEHMKSMIMQSSTTDRIEDQLKAIGELMVSTSVFSSAINPSLSQQQQDFDPHVQQTNNTSGKRKRKTRSSGESASNFIDDGDWAPAKAAKKRKRSNTKPTNHQCSECDFTCISLWSYNAHISSKHGAKDAFKCSHPGCEFTASTKYFLVKHGTAEHGIAPVKATGKTRKPYKKRSATVDDNSYDDDLSKEIEVIESFLEDEEEMDGESDEDNENDEDWVPGDDDVAVEENVETTDKPLKEKKQPKRQPKKRGRKPGPPLDCPHEGCNYHTTRASHMNRHRISVHKDVIEITQKEGKPKKQRKPREKKPPGLGAKRVRSKEKKYSCDICGAKAVSMWYINRHMRIHTGEKPFICPHPGCEYRSYRKFHLKRHDLNIHSTLRPFKCSSCDYATKTKEGLKQHEVVRHSTERNEHCKYCDYTAKLRDVIRSHTRKLHKFICEPCLWEFTDERSLAEHLNRHQESGILCQFCTNVATDIASLKSHSVEEHKIVLETRRPRKSRWLPVCEICHYQFPSPAALDSHRSHHTPDGAIMCHICHQLFLDMESLKEHTFTQHGFGIEAQRKRQRIHVRTYCCSMCNYEFVSDYALQDHSQRHRQDGSIVCSNCSHISIKMSEMVEHCLLNHNIDLQASPRKRKNFFCCKICKYLFPSTSKLDAHKAQHQSDGSIKCAHCPAFMSNMKDMKDHMMLMHNIKMESTEQRPRPAQYACVVCNYLFDDKIQLATHRSCHMPDGSICCSMCPYSCMNMEFIKIHMAEVHNVILNSEKKEHRRRKGDIPLGKKKKLKNHQLSQLPNHNITDILYGTQTPEYESPTMNRSYINDVSSYISPPSCAFDGSSASALNYDTRVQNPFATLTTANLFGHLNKTDLNFMTSNASLTITNSNTNFSFGARGAALTCGSAANSGVLSSANQLPSAILLENNSVSRGSTQALNIDLSTLIPGGLPIAAAVPNKLNQLAITPKKSKETLKKLSQGECATENEAGKTTNAPSKLKAFPGLFM